MKFADCIGKVYLYESGRDLFAVVNGAKVYLINPESETEYEDHTAFGLPEDARRCSYGVSSDVEIPDEIL